LCDYILVIQPFFRRWFSPCRPILNSLRVKIIIIINIIIIIILCVYCASSPTLTLEDITRLTLERFSSVGRAPTSATEPLVQLDLESGAICRQTSNSRTCHTAVLDSWWRDFYLGDDTKRSVNLPSFKCTLEILLLAASKAMRLCRPGPTIDWRGMKATTAAFHGCTFHRKRYGHRTLIFTMSMWKSNVNSHIIVAKYVNMSDMKWISSPKHVRITAKINIGLFEFLRRVSEKNATNLAHSIYCTSCKKFHSHVHEKSRTLTDSNTAISGNHIIPVAIIASIFLYMGWRWRNSVCNSYRRHVGGIPVCIL